MKRKVVMCVLAIMLLSIKLFSQGGSFVNRVFQNTTGTPLFNPVLNPLGVQWSKSIKAASGDLIMVGYTSVTGEGQNIYLIKQEPDGTILFENNFNTSGTNNDYGLGLVEASNGDIYICGTTDNGSSSYDLVVLRVNSAGNLIGSVLTKDGPAGNDDVGVSIAINSSGQVFIAGNTLDNFGLSDFWILKYTNTLGFITQSTYDYAGLTDVALGLSFVSSGNVVVIGPSASGATSCDYVQVVFNSSSLSYISETRNNVLGSALDQALDFCKDTNDNTYITGKTWNGTNFDIKTIKINANFTMGWTATVNPSGMDDAGTTITTDGSGNVIVGGYTTKANNIKDLICIKYNSFTGSLMWPQPYIQSSKNLNADASIKQVCTNPNNDDIYFVAFEEGLTGYKQSLVTRLSASGIPRWFQNVSYPASDILPSDITYESGDVFVISVLDSTTNHYLTTKYRDLDLDTARTFKNGIQVWKKRELIVSFLPGAINTATINSDNIMFGNLNEFLTGPANSAIASAFYPICHPCDIKAVKVYENAKTNDTIAISRLGQNVAIPSFWSTLLLQIPNTITNQQAQSILNGLKNIVSYAHPNYFVQAASPPNDSLYNLQVSLHLVSPNTNAHINVEEAWDVVQDCGSSFVKCGVFDTGVEWRHKDFGYDGTPTSGKVQGWHFDTGLPNGVNLRTNQYIIDPDYDGHGTAAAGIIGAQRNNTSGIAGIAGGDNGNSNSGVALYSLNALGCTLYSLCKGLHESCLTGISILTPYRYGLHLSNHSYIFSPNNTPADSLSAFREQIRFANRMHITMACARGNDASKAPLYPACFDSTWVISVGGTGANGQKHPNSSYGAGIDVSGPAVSTIVRSTNEDGFYQTFNGTSAAAPHVSGVVGLLMSYMNVPGNNYNNLAPEDCEFIINHSATDIESPGYDSLTGYGRVNAGKALRLVEKPYRWLYHYGTNPMTPHTISKSVYSNNDTIKLTETYQNYTSPRITYPKGKYIVKHGRSLRPRRIMQLNLRIVLCITGNATAHHTSILYPMLKKDLICTSA